MFDQKVVVVLKVQETSRAIENSRRRIHGAAFHVKTTGRDLDEMKNMIWLAMEDNISRRIESGISTVDGKHLTPDSSFPQAFWLMLALPALLLPVIGPFALDSSKTSSLCAEGSGFCSPSRVPVAYRESPST
ncbi:unnamed protein product [Allacma fusca]|uniref:Uncharacterized protein n=1 Tax=Allacma fusca TaxID=39272 RepID=A0A8J2P155_9HEXA|nr:unnamed protein product [Allacma fusca]